MTPRSRGAFACPRRSAWRPRLALVLLAVAALVAGVGCSRDGGEAERQPTATDRRTTEEEPSRVRIDVRSETDTTGDTGTFAMSGAMDDSGTFTTVDNRDEGGLDRTFEGAEGELVLHLQLLRVGPGVVEYAWTVRSGSGQYEGARGEGTGGHRLTTGRMEGVLTGTLER